jgi:PIN domain nuclease of toxin-antitoxin system
MIVMDTHAWLWWLSGDDDLSPAARDAIGRGLDGGILGVSAISVWEAALLVQKGRLLLAIPIDEIVAHCERLPGFQFLPVTPRIALASVALGLPHPDPADRLIAATTLAHGATLVTRDDRLRRLSAPPTLW